MKISSLFKPLSLLPALALMYMIYSFSAQPANSSSSSSYYVSRKLVQAVNTVSGQHWDDWEVEQYAAKIHGPMRKAAHITEYFLLAVAVSFPLYVYGVRGILLMLLAGIICVGYACGDEYHQSLVSGRSASLRDVAIDSIGIFFGVILTRLIGWSGRMAITGPAYERRQKKQQKELDEREEELRRREEALRREQAYYQRQRSSRRSPQRSAASSYPSPDEYPYDSRRGTDPRYDGRRTNQQYDERRVNPQYDGRGMDPQYGSRGMDPYQSPDQPAPGSVSDRTRVIGTRSEVDDRTRVYRSEEEQRRMKEAYRAQVYERRKVQSPRLSEDSTSDQLSEDLPFSGLFGKKKQK